MNAIVRFDPVMQIGIASHRPRGATVAPLESGMAVVLAAKIEPRPDAVLKAQLIAGIPKLRAFAMSLSGSPDRADDLVQETLLKAWAHLDTFVTGSNLGAWLFTILRNCHYTTYRKHRREVCDSEGHHAAGLSVGPSQLAHMDMVDFQIALAQVPIRQREALILVGASGYSCEEAAVISGCAVGTIKSRVNRARRQLEGLLAVRPSIA